MTEPDTTTRPNARRVPPWEDLPAEQQTPPLFDLNDTTTTTSAEQEGHR